MTGIGTNSNTAEGDLAFLKAVVEEGSRARMSGGAAFVAGGLLYALQCFVGWGQLKGFIHLSKPVSFWFAIGITVAFLVAIGVVFWRGRKNRPQGIGARAINAAFASTGLANVSMVCVFANVAIQQKNLLIWFLYPAVVCAIQGAVWYIAFMLRRRAWLAVVAFGWFATAVTLGFVIGTPEYALVLGSALVLFMAVPGFVMIHLARANA